MAEPAPFAWTPRGAWDGIAVAGRHGAPAGPAGLRVMPLEGLALASVIARGGATDEAARALSEHIGAPVTSSRCAFFGSGALIGSGPGEWLFVGTMPQDVERLMAAAGANAAVFDQSGSRGILRLSGLRVRDVLAKGCPIDLHPRAFGVGDAAATVIAHIGVLIWQVDEAPAYDLAVPRSMAGSFWSWLAASAAAYGCEVTVPQWA